MTTLIFKNTINAPIQTVFDLSRNVGAHVESTIQTGEKIIGGRKSGLLELGETVTWQGKHFGFTLTHKSVISEMREPDYFVDEMVDGKFKSFRHEHFFEADGNRCVVTNIIRYSVPMGFIGKIVDRIALKAHLHQLLLKRNLYIKEQCEINGARP